MLICTKIMSIMSLVQIESGTFARNTSGIDSSAQISGMPFPFLGIKIGFSFYIMSLKHLFNCMVQEWSFCLKTPYTGQIHLLCPTVKTVQWSNFIVQMLQAVTPCIAWKFYPHSSPVFILHKASTYNQFIGRIYKCICKLVAFINQLFCC